MLGSGVVSEKILSELRSLHNPLEAKQLTEKREAMMDFLAEQRNQGAALRLITAARRDRV